MLLKNIDFHFTELPSVQEYFTTNLQIKNIISLSNFRIQETHLPKLKGGKDCIKPLKVVFLSRIIKEKGYPLIFEILQEFKNDQLSDIIDVSFYGSIRETEKIDFENNIEKFSNCQYKGILPPNEIPQVLANFDVLILPTTYQGEGLPGAIIDAYMAGIPVLVNNWMEISTFINQGKTGYFVDNNNVKDYSAILKDLQSNSQTLKHLKLNARKEYEEKYHHENIWNTLNMVCKFDNLH